jgi:hypothetical protein
MLVFTSARTVAGVDLDYIQNYFDHFYGTDDFQLWSMNNNDMKIKDSWKTYKWPCKDIIYEYTKDADYRDNKTKMGSLYRLLLQRSPFIFVDDSMHMYEDLNIQEYYNPKNDFIV